MQHHFISSVFLCVVATTTAPSRPSTPVTSSAAWSQIWEEMDDCPTPFGMCEWEAIITGVNPVHLDGIDVLGIIILQVTRDWQAVTCGSNPQASGGQLMYFELLEVLKRSAGPWHLISTVPIPPVEFQVDVVVRSKFIPFDGNELESGEFSPCHELGRGRPPGLLEFDLAHLHCRLDPLVDECV